MPRPSDAEARSLPDQDDWGGELPPLQMERVVVTNRYVHENTHALVVAERDRLREDAFTPEEIKLMAREISGMCDNAADGGSIPPVLWRQLANKLDRLARTSDETDAPKETT